ncbi:uncharacterized protein LOC135342284 [Halichondria panicea]|uniref:uncharacterized protein LOC135342284 n=1 Tax=Halichondria panicea TaxID=6063 RepID=UPI00312B36DD
MTTACPEIVWKNTRKRSFYNREGDYGFIYRVLDVENEGCANDDEQDDEVVDLEEVRRQVEVDRFLAELRKGVVKAGGGLTEEQLDEGFRQLAKDLTDNNLYMRFLEEKEVVRKDPTAEESHVTQLMATLTQSIDKYKRELAEWAAVLEERKQVTEQAKEGYSKEKHLHFLKLPARDVEPLKSFLSPEQLSLIESEDSSEFVGTTNQQLDLLECQLDQELTRLSSLCDSSHQPNMLLDQSVMKATPRTLFRAVIDTDPNRTLS